MFVKKYFNMRCYANLKKLDKNVKKESLHLTEVTMCAYSLTSVSYFIYIHIIANGVSLQRGILFHRNTQRHI